MKTLSLQFDSHLSKRLWSLWTELGVAGLERSHQSTLILPEELIFLTTAISNYDPRLRDEALDWCGRYSRYISATLLRSLLKKHKNLIGEDFSLFSTTLNQISNTNWPTSEKVDPLNIKLSKKSKIRPFSNPSMLLFRLRALFGVNARADVIAYFLADQNSDYSAAEISEIGYTKRHLTEVLQDLHAAEILEMRLTGNQMRFSWKARKKITSLLSPLPKEIPLWYTVLNVLLPIRCTIKKVEGKSIETKVVELRNTLLKLDTELKRLKLSPPSFEQDLTLYWNKVSKWIINFIKTI